MPKHIMQVSGEFGEFRMNIGIRYGFLDRLDGGLYYGVDAINQRKKLPLFSGDVKYKLIGTQEKHYVISTGAGFGSGVEYSYSWNETKPHYYEEDVWHHYGGSSMDGYVPIYFSGYMTFPKSILSFTYNPYLLYRFGFYDNFHPGGYYNQYNITPVYKNMGKGLIGNAISITAKYKYASIYGVVNIQKYLNYKGGPGNGSTGGDVYVGVSWRFNLGRKMK
ncbi:MAG TPA: hypothetical protein VE978_03330 [Chitinophagales bacterium]|nr:hypothetical protein [Chitinophagales bacterium]